MLEQRIQQQFFEAADLQYQAAETLARPLADAAQALVGGITGGGKLLVAGVAGGGVLARHFALTMLGRHERERPPLAALALADEGELAALRPGGALAQQVQALGHPGDVLLLVAGTAPAALLQAVVEAAHAREMTVVALGADGDAAAGWKALLTETDVAVAVPHERAPRVLEAQLVALHCLCDAVDLQLMGEQDAS